MALTVGGARIADMRRTAYGWPARIVRPALVAFFLSLLAPAWAQESLPVVEVYRPASCLACIDWAEHLMQNGFKVTFRETADMAAVKRRLKVPAALESVHTAVVDGYFVEGHVPAEDIKLLLRERPKARGLAVPGLPRGAPGYEGASSSSTCESGCSILDRAQGTHEIRREMFDTLLVGRDGKAGIFARH